MNEKNAVANITETAKPSGSNAAKVSSRRKFLGQVGAALAGGAVLGKAAVASAQDYNRAVGDTNALLSGVFDLRVRQSFALRLEAATRSESSSLDMALCTIAVICGIRRRFFARARHARKLT